MARCGSTSSIASIPEARRSAVGPRIGAYQVIAALGRGGTAGVYLAEHGATGERVALKVLDPSLCDDAETVRRLFSERAISARVCHAGLLDVRLAARTDAGVPYLVMEYLEGESLEALLARGSLGCDTLVAIAGQVAAALGALHAAGFVHGDIKPANVLVLSRPDRAGRPRIKLIDFGVARRLDAAPALEISIAGTPAYMAPEQWRGQPSVASDVYSLGCLLYEILAGRPVFVGSLPYLMACHRHRRPAPLSAHRAGIAPALERLILRSLAKEPAHRPSTAELLAGLGGARPVASLAAAS